MSSERHCVQGQRRGAASPKLAAQFGIHHDESVCELSLQLAHEYNRAVGSRTQPWIVPPWEAEQTRDDMAGSQHNWEEDDDRVETIRIGNDARGRRDD